MCLTHLCDNVQHNIRIVCVADAQMVLDKEYHLNIEYLLCIHKSFLFLFIKSINYFEKMIPFITKYSATLVTTLDNKYEGHITTTTIIGNMTEARIVENAYI